MNRLSLHAPAVLLLLAAAIPSPEVRYFRYVRSLQDTPAEPKQTCVVADAPLFAHSEPGFSDLRLYRNRDETPYLIHAPAIAATSEKTVALLNLGSRAGQTVFDAAMPSEAYSDLELNVGGQDFLATVTVSGSQDQASRATTIGSYTIFDLTHQRLGRSTVLHLPSSDYRYLHFRIAGPIRPEDVAGLRVSQAPVTPPRYATIAESSQVVLKGRTSVVEFNLSSRVPVDRIEIVPDASPANFSRSVHVMATPVIARPASDTLPPPQSASSYGDVLRVHTVQGTRHIDEEVLAVEPPKLFFDGQAKWTISIDNGDDAPLRPALVRLLMLERNLCFDAQAGAAYSLYYGDPALAAPRYDYAALFAPQPDATQATAGPEMQNPEYQSRPDERPFTEKHPVLLWIALVLVVGLLTAIAARAAKSTPTAAR